jgi:hypothetical protein
MEIRNLMDTLAAALLHRRAAAPPILVRPIRASLADMPLRPRPRPPYRPAPPIRPASNM